MRNLRVSLHAALACAAAICTALSVAAAPSHFTPLVDYHQHLASPAGVALLRQQDPMQAEVPVPADVAALLRDIEAHWNDRAAISQHYKDDVVVLGNEVDPSKPWIKGRDEAAEYTASLYGGPYRLTPVMFDANQRYARVAGYSARGDGAATQYFGYFFFLLERAPKGPWMIAVDQRMFERRPYYQPTIVGPQLLSELDKAGIGQAVVLSDAYWFDAPTYRDKSKSDAEVYSQVRAENDWTAAQAAASGGRLVAFCSFNPLEPYALAELRRCANTHRFAGMKLHLQMSGVDLHNSTDLDALGNVFLEADRLHMAITVHAQTEKPYDAAAAQNFVDKVLPRAQHVPVIIAHLWGGGPFAREPLQVYVKAMEKSPGRRSNLYFDVAEAALVAGGDKQVLSEIAAAIRKIGTKHVLFGSDAVGEFTLPPVKAAAQFRSDVPLTEAEFEQIAKNHLPFMPPINAVRSSG